MFATDDTIVAVATPHGHAGLGVVRLSGPDAQRVAQALVRRNTLFEPRHATFAHIVEPAGQDDAPRVLDQVVVTLFAGPHSYTGDDVIEIGAHGSPVVLQRIVELAMAAGARLAEPGEFTLRAYLNGRIDLVQAEAVADLVDAVTPLQARAALDQLEGTLTGAIGRIDAAIFDLSARLEASLDFPDEGFHFITRDEARAEIARIGGELATLSAEGRVGRVVREGRTVVIVGRPNAGKSSLFNALVGASRAIVTAVPGTTRDLLTERVDIGGLLVTLVDTAGLRDAGDPIEAEGVSRARQARQAAALAVVVLDGSAPLDSDDERILRETTGRRLVVASKRDLTAAWTAVSHAVDVPVSAATGEGIEILRERLVAALVDREQLRDVPAMSNARHAALVDDARAALGRADAALAEGRTEELVLTDLTAARLSLEEVTGRRAPDAVLRHIFEKFCVGK